MVRVRFGAKQEDNQWAVGTVFIFGGVIGVITQDASTVDLAGDFEVGQSYVYEVILPETHEFYKMISSLNPDMPQTGVAAIPATWPEEIVIYFQADLLTKGSPPPNDNGKISPSLVILGITLVVGVPALIYALGKH